MGALEELRRDPSEPLDLCRFADVAPAAWPSVRAHRFELTSRGDRVPGRLWLPPDGTGPFPLVLLQHGAGGSKQAEYLDATAGPWALGGAAVASIDFPLHGERTDSKLTPRVLAMASEPGSARRDWAARLWRDFARQAVLDLQATLDALATLPEIDAERVAYASFSLGTILGATFCGIDPRPRAAALAIGGGGIGPPEVDPLSYIGAFAPRPLLFVNSTRDEVIPRAASEALYEAAGDPKEIVWFDATHSGLPGRALKAMWTFLAPQLELGDVG